MKTAAGELFSLVPATVIQYTHTTELVLICGRLLSVSVSASPPVLAAITEDCDAIEEVGKPMEVEGVVEHEILVEIDISAIVPCDVVSETGDDVEVWAGADHDTILVVLTIDVD